MLGKMTMRAAKKNEFGREICDFKIAASEEPKSSNRKSPLFIQVSRRQWTTGDDRFRGLESHPLRQRVSCETRMLFRTVKQVRRIFLIVAGFTLLLLRIVMIFTPGPGTPVILLGLGLLAVEFVWARRLMERLKREGTRFKDAFLRPEK